MKVRSVLVSILLILVSIITGLGIAAWRIASLQHSTAFSTYGSWKGTNDLPLNKDNLVTTQVTLFALFALPSNEAVYLFASEDNTHQRLDARFDYYITGNTHNIDAEYWSITAYGKDLYLIPNEASRYSFNRDNLKTDSAGNFEIVVSSYEGFSDSVYFGNETPPLNWLPVNKSKSGQFELVLRIYHGKKDFMERLEDARLPRIRRQWTD